MTPDILADALDCPLARAAKWCDSLNAAMAEFGINTPERIAAFVAQIGHESGRLLYVKELWGPTPAQERYEGRMSLGNTETGDGFRFRGRGLIQVTGRSNYRDAGKALGLDLEAHPELLEQPVNAARSAAWFWESHGLNELADAAFFDRITKTINGGFNGQAERVELWERAKEAFV